MKIMRPKKAQARVDPRCFAVGVPMIGLDGLHSLYDLDPENGFLDKLCGKLDIPEGETLTALPLRLESVGTYVPFQSKDGRIFLLWDKYLPADPEDSLLLKDEFESFPSLIFKVHLDKGLAGVPPVADEEYFSMIKSVLSQKTNTEKEG